MFHFSLHLFCSNHIARSTHTARSIVVILFFLIFSFLLLFTLLLLSCYHLPLRHSLSFASRRRPCPLFLFRLSIFCL